MPGSLMADEMGLRMTFTAGAAAMPFQWVPEKVEVELPLSILWENTYQQ
jgi:hypothetical protein